MPIVTVALHIVAILSSFLFCIFTTKKMRVNPWRSYE
jgi:hypothetical protein